MDEYTNYCGETVKASEIVSREDYYEADAFLKKYVEDPRGLDLVRKYNDPRAPFDTKKEVLRRYVDEGRVIPQDEYKKVMDIVMSSGKKLALSPENQVKYNALKLAGTLRQSDIENFKAESRREQKQLHARWQQVYQYLSIGDGIEANADLFLSDKERKDATQKMDAEIEWEAAKKRARDHYNSLKGLDAKLAFAKRNPEFFHDILK